ncbi:MAG: ornithine--oxo-acid transaminase [Candidatus Eremiobacteraeota bacterium]|nr:ornithine--oxo-acid transaminase [Candidatus Eremiobacteraeota bacterium]
MVAQTTEAIIKETESYSAHNYHPLPVVLVKGEGIWVWDAEGRKYLDMLSAYSALNQGHRHPAILKALVEQAEKITVTSRAFHNELMGKFLGKLCELCGQEAALPMNTGAEAVETAIKAARKWGYYVKKVKPEKAHIIVCENNFHGRTTTIVGFSSEHQYRDGFGPFTPGFEVIPYGDLEALRKAITADTAAFMVEPIQGEAGINIPPEGYLKKARDLCRERRVLFMADEIQTGFGRTGKLFCCDHEEVKPDVLIVGKALGGGVYPVSAALSSREVMDVFKPGDHGSTFGGNPLASAVAMASLKVIIEERLPQRSSDLGAFFLERLRSIRSPHIREVRGKGLMIGLEIKKESGPARPFCEKLQSLGILAKETHGQVIRFAPPLVIKKEDLEWASLQIEKVLTE